MKIAVASDGNIVSAHFGHCEKFIIFENEENKIAKKEELKNPGHKPGFLPVFLHENGVNVIIAGGMGGGAVDLFNQKGIEVIVGANGDSQVAAEGYFKGELKTTGSICHDHNHAD